MSMTQLPIRTLLLILFGASTVCVVADEVTVEQIREAWKARDAATKSIQYVCKLVLSEVVIIQGDNDPFGVNANKQPKAPVSLASDLTFSIKGDKAACVHSGHLGWDSQRGVPSKLIKKCSFDGKTGKVFYQGEIAPPAELTRGKMPDQLGNQMHYNSVWLGYSPESYFTRKGFYQLKRMEIKNAEVVWDDRRVVELAIPSDASPLSLCMLYVDLEKGFAPIRAVTVFKGTPRTEVTLDYVKDDQIGWRLASWSHTWGTQEDVTQSDGAVERCIVNEDIDDSAFDIQFPVGTSVRNGDTYLVQGADGQLRPK